MRSRTCSMTVRSLIVFFRATIPPLHCAYHSLATRIGLLPPIILFQNSLQRLTCLGEGAGWQAVFATQVGRQAREVRAGVVTHQDEEVIAVELQCVGETKK